MIEGFFYIFYDSAFATVGHPRVSIGPVGSSMDHLRLTSIGYLKATVTHIRVTLGHLRVTLGNCFL